MNILVPYTGLNLYPHQRLNLSVSTCACVHTFLHSHALFLYNNDMVEEMLV